MRDSDYKQVLIPTFCGAPEFFDLHTIRTRLIIVCCFVTKTSGYNFVVSSPCLYDKSNLFYIMSSLQSFNNVLKENNHDKRIRILTNV